MSLGTVLGAGALATVLAWVVDLRGEDIEDVAFEEFDDDAVGDGGAW